MSDDLGREVELLCAQFGQEQNRNVGFISERLFPLMKAGHRLADIESELRRRDAPIFLVGLPLSGSLAHELTLTHPDDAVDDGQLRFYLWIGINGRAEVDHVLADASIPASANLANLDATGLLTRRYELPPDPTARELLEWLAREAMSWAERKSTIGEHLDLLRTGEARRELAEFAARPDPDEEGRARRAAVAELALRAPEDGIRLAAQNCGPLVREALDAFLGAPTWAGAARVYQAYEDELSGDLAQEILLRISRQFRLTEAQGKVIDAHVQTLETAWERGIEEAIAAAEREFPVKLGTPTAEDYLHAYLEAPDLEAARDALRAAPPELLQLDEEAVAESLRWSEHGDDLWRAGMLEDARARGADAAYRDWAELRSIEGGADDGEAIERLTALLARHHGCLRDRTLEQLLERYMHLGDLDSQRATAQELADHRSAGSPPSQRPLDLGNLGLILARQGDLAAARASLREALALMASLRDRGWRGLLWHKTGVFSRYYDHDPAMALHSFRVAVEEFRAAGDLLSAADALEEIGSIYRSQDRLDLVRVYAILGHGSMGHADGQQRGMTGDFAEVLYRVEKGLAETEFLFDSFAAAASRLKRLMSVLPPQAGGEARLDLERIALAAAIASGDQDLVREIMTPWPARGLGGLTTVAHAAITLAELAACAPDQPIEPAQLAALAGLADALVELGVSRPDAGRFVAESGKPADFNGSVLRILAGIRGGQTMTYVANRLVSEDDDAAWLSRAERAAFGRPPRTGQPGEGALPPGATWPEVIARYRHLGAWELPDLAVLGAILDRWSLRSRFEGAIRINPPSPAAGCLNFYFYSADPEGHLERSVGRCAYVPDGELIVCSLPYLEAMFRLSDDRWEAELADMEGRKDEEGTGSLMARIARGYERVLVEWILAHEVGHAHHGHAAAPSADGALALEEAADAFFLDGVLADESLPVLLLAFYSILNRLYQYDCQQQFHRTVIPKDLLDHPVVLDAAPDATGHRPLVFRAVSLVKSILRMRPDLEDSRYINEFEASLGQR